MYSRKYIRSPGITPSAERILPAAGGTSPSTAARTEERTVTLPPDYTGMAFSGSGKSSSLQKPRDYPETLILPLSEEIPPEADEEAAHPSVDECEITSSIPSASLEAELPLPSDEDEAPPLTDEEAHKAFPWSVAEAPASAESEARRDVSASAESLPILTPELLRSLTLEDLLLFWMLLMLMVSSQEDQIYLLLGLLLIQR